MDCKMTDIIAIISSIIAIGYSIFPSDNGIIYITPCKMRFRLVNTAFSAC